MHARPYDVFASHLAGKFRQGATEASLLGAYEAGACLYALADKVEQEEALSIKHLVQAVRDYADRNSVLMWEDAVGDLFSIPQMVESLLSSISASTLIQNARVREDHHVV